VHSSVHYSAMAKDQYLAGKLAIVTGAAKPNGMGAAIAYALAEHGANVR
jgi:NAD(P)-dependent dehydrogenase (short-subunit alcohol dehydrogenase family)